MSSLEQNKGTYMVIYIVIILDEQLSLSLLRDIVKNIAFLLQACQQCPHSNDVTAMIQVGSELLT